MDPGYTEDVDVARWRVAIGGIVRVVAVDPGRDAGGWAVVEAEGERLVELGTWQRRARRGRDAWTVRIRTVGCAGEAGEDSSIAYSLGQVVARAALLAGDAVAVVEAVALRRGKGSPVTLAEAAGAAVATLELAGATEVLRPTPDAWRTVYTGRRLVALRREEAKRIALAWGTGRPIVGLRSAPAIPPAWASRELDGWPDHALEAAAMATWAARKGAQGGGDG